MRQLLLILLLLAAPAAAQTATNKVYRLGVLAPSTDSLEFTRTTTIAELARLGFGAGSNLVLDERIGVGNLPDLARQMASARPDAIFAIGPEALRAAREATATVPIVAFALGPVLDGYAENRAHPGGNVTGVAIPSAELDGKRIELLHKAVPAAHRMAELMLDSPSWVGDVQRMRVAAATLGMDFLAFKATGPEDYPAAFAAMRAAGAEALAIEASPIFFRDGASLAAMALAARLPTACEWAEMAHSGCLIGYGPSRTEMRQRNADQIARIFRGAAPGDVPIETATRFEFAINLRIAKTLGLAVPPSLLARADEVIE
jgi:ABC-type uncharacterized transport system substrate-binding protein